MRDSLFSFAYDFLLYYLLSHLVECVPAHSTVIFICVHTLLTANTVRSTSCHIYSTVRLHSLVDARHVTKCMQVGNEGEIFVKGTSTLQNFDEVLYP